MKGFSLPVQKKNNARSGFTLIELLVSIAIFGMLSVAIGWYLVAFLNLKFNAEMHQRLRQEGNYVMDRIDYLIRNGITLPHVCDDGFINVSTYDILKTNTQGSTIFDKFKKFQVAKGGSSGSDTVAVCELAPDKKHDVNCSPSLPEADGSVVHLMSPLGGSTGEYGGTLKVNKLNFGCSLSDITSGYMVTTELVLEYSRRTMGADKKTIVEKFYRETAVRNTAKYEN